MPIAHQVKGGAKNPALRVFLAVPTYTGDLPAVFVTSLVESLEILKAANIGYELVVEAGNCHVDDARNGLVRLFLASDCDTFVFLDADIGWEGEDLLKLIRTSKDVVAGVYPKKQSPEDFPVLTRPGELWADSEGLVEVEGVPTGFLKISRAVLETMAAKAVTFLGQDGVSEYPLIFERTIIGGKRRSGDYAFCYKWRESGGRIYVDPEMHFKHEGKHVWQGSLGAFWKREHGLEEAARREAFDAAMDSLKAGDASAEVFGTLFEAWANPWAARPEFLAACHSLSRNGSGPILECGSGLTTFVMAFANPKRQIHSLEHDPVFASRTNAILKKYGIANVTLHYADLATYDGRLWYDVSDISQLDWALVLCDGPPRKQGDRTKLFTVLGHAIANATILMDDADDELARAPLREWAAKAGRDVEIMGAERYFALAAPRKLAKAA